MAENNIAGFKKLIRYAQNLAEYEQGIAEGIIDENVFVIVLDEKVAKFKGQTFDWSGGGGSIDLSTLATKEEVQNLTNEMIANEEVHAAALNDLNDRINEISENVSGAAATKEELEAAINGVVDTILENEEVAAAAFNDLNESIASKADKTYVEEYVLDALGNVSVDTSTLVTKDEFTDVEEVWAASYNLLNQKISDVQQYIYDEAASRRQFDEAIAEIQSILAENESVVTAAWNQLNTRINALEAAQARGE